MHSDLFSSGYDLSDVPRQSRGFLSPRLALWLLALGAIVLLSAWLAVEVVVGRYEGRICPHVTALDVDLGGLRPSEASDRLTEAFSHYDAGLLTLTDGQRAWAVPWVEIGLRLDVDTVVQSAFAVGREDQDLWTLLRSWVEHHEIAPVFVIDPAIARSALERLAPEVSVPPTDATLRREGNQLVAVPSQPGWALDVETTLERLIATLTYPDPDNQFALAFRAVPPRIADASPALTQAEEVLNRQVYISAYDVLTDEAFTWRLGRDGVLTWLRVDRTQDGRGLNIGVAKEAVQATLAGLASELGEDRGFRLGEATEQVLKVFEAGGGAVEIYLTHSPRTYVVQPGDTLTTISARVGMPVGLIIEANPDVDLNDLHIGQELTIPSQDVLTPYLPVPGKQIVVSIAKQRMRVYEWGQLLYQWPVSTGMASSPTHTGIFQILSKQEEAYASQWDLWMPHFMAVYRVGGDVYNGIHALPLLSSGRRLWEGTLGSPASYGCIILGIQEAETLYNWADIGVLVIIE